MTRFFASSSVEDNGSRKGAGGQEPLRFIRDGNVFPSRGTERIVPILFVSDKNPTPPSPRSLHSVDSMDSVGDSFGEDRKDEESHMHSLRKSTIAKHMSLDYGSSSCNRRQVQQTGKYQPTPPLRKSSFNPKPKNLAYLVHESAGFSKSCGNFPNLPGEEEEEEDDRSNFFSASNRQEDDTWSSNRRRCDMTANVPINCIASQDVILEDDYDEGMCDSNRGVVYGSGGGVVTTANRSSVFSSAAGKTSCTASSVHGGSSVRSGRTSITTTGGVIGNAAIANLNVQQKFLSVTNSFPDLVNMDSPGTQSLSQVPLPKKLPRTLSTSALRIKGRSPAWLKFWQRDSTVSPWQAKQ